MDASFPEEPSKEAKAASTIARVVRGHLARVRALRLQLIKERNKLKLQALKSRKKQGITEFTPNIQNVVVQENETSPTIPHQLELIPTGHLKGDTNILQEQSNPELPLPTIILNKNCIDSNCYNNITHTPSQTRSASSFSRKSTAPTGRRQCVFDTPSKSAQGKKLPSIADLLKLASAPSSFPVAELLANRCDDVSIITSNTKTVYTVATTHKPLITHLEPPVDDQTAVTSASTYFSTPPRVSQFDNDLGSATGTPVISLPAPTVSRSVKKEMPKPFLKIDGLEPKSYMSRLLKEPPKPTKRTATRARQAERERAAIEIQRCYRGYVARKLARIRKQQLADRFTCSRCGRTQLPGEYCKGCGRKLPRHIARRSTSRRGSLRGTDGDCIYSRRQRPIISSSSGSVTHWSAPDNPYRQTSTVGLSATASEERQLLGDLFELEQRQRRRQESIAASQAREAGLRQLQTDIWTQLQSASRSQTSSWNPSIPSDSQAPDPPAAGSAAISYPTSLTRKPPKESLAFTPGARDFKPLLLTPSCAPAKRVAPTSINADKEIETLNEGVLSDVAAPPTAPESNKDDDTAELHVERLQLEIEALQPVALNKRLEGYCIDRGSYSASPLVRTGVNHVCDKPAQSAPRLGASNRRGESSASVNLPPIRIISNVQSSVTRPATVGVTAPQTFDSSHKTASAVLHLPSIQQKPKPSAPPRQNSFLFNQVKV